ncbi:MAG TPA: ABC transporter permease, partial [Caulobacteraceae bacterium]|nr:ABC transporter permease [Caulobacteraceae bacterium]
MSRILKIARREYIAYIRTLGFWLSMLLMPVGIAVAGGAPLLMERAAPSPTLAIVDLSGRGYGEAIAPRLSDAAKGAKPAAILVDPPVAISDPAQAGAALRPWLLGERLLAGGRKLDAVAILHPGAIDFWSASLTDRSLETAVSNAVTDAMRGERLRAAGLTREEVRALDELEPKLTAYSPKAAAGAGEVSLRDRLPGIVGFALGMLLWSVIFTGAGILLNSVIEEKSSRILEVLLSSASPPEIMFGKIIGAAGVTLTVLAVWVGLGGTFLALADPEIAADVGAVLVGKGLIFYFALYLVGGYLMYASLFIAIGAFCETTREAQTLLGPVMIVLTIPLVFMSQAIRRPDAPLLEALSWVPPFTPFIMTARAASEPPLWQVIATSMLMLAMTALVVWIAGRAFRAGALSTGRVNFAGLIAHVRR